jgi:hypothetical protein
LDRVGKGVQPTQRRERPLHVDFVEKFWFLQSLGILLMSMDEEKIAMMGALR